MVFLYDDRVFTYDDLLNAVSGSNTYCPLYRTDELFPFFVNLVKALAAGLPLTLLDSDIKASEIDGIDEDAINQEESFEAGTYCGADEIVAAMEASDYDLHLRNHRSAQKDCTYRCIPDTCRKEG